MLNLRWIIEAFTFLVENIYNVCAIWRHGLSTNSGIPKDQTVLYS